MSLDKERVDAIRAQSKELVDSMGKAAAAATDLWEARLNMALASNDEQMLREVLSEASAQAWGDRDVNCPCQGRELDITDIARNK